MHHALAPCSLYEDRNDSILPQSLKAYMLRGWRHRQKPPLRCPTMSAHMHLLRGRRLKSSQGMGYLPLWTKPSTDLSRQGWIASRRLRIIQFLFFAMLRAR